MPGAAAGVWSLILSPAGAVIAPALNSVAATIVAPASAGRTRRGRGAITAYLLHVHGLLGDRGDDDLAEPDLLVIALDHDRPRLGLLGVERAPGNAGDLRVVVDRLA